MVEVQCDLEYSHTQPSSLELFFNNRSIGVFAAQPAFPGIAAFPVFGLIRAAILSWSPNTRYLLLDVDVGGSEEERYVEDALDATTMALALQDLALEGLTAHDPDIVDAVLHVARRAPSAPRDPAQWSHAVACCINIYHALARGEVDAMRLDFARGRVYIYPRAERSGQSPALGACVFTQDP